MVYIIILSIVIACVLSILIVKVWSNTNTISNVSSTHPVFGAIGPPGPNNGGEPVDPASGNQSGNEGSAQPGDQGSGNSEG